MSPQNNRLVLVRACPQNIETRTLVASAPNPRSVDEAPSNWKLNKVESTTVVAFVAAFA